MRMLKVKTLKDSPDLVRSVSSSTSQFPNTKIIEIIDAAKTFEKGRQLKALREIVENYNKEDYITEPGKLSLDISDTGEKAYQRAIFISGKTQLNTLGEIVWKDLELPVVFNKSSRRRCIDLVGAMSNGLSVLCELKFATQKSNSNSPVYAIIELLIYYYLIQENYESLDERKVYHKNEIVKPFKWKDLTQHSVFIVAGNEKYWSYWQRRYEKKKNDLADWLRVFPLRVHLFSSSNFDFKEQKGHQNKYRPSLADKSEWKEIFL